MFGAGLDDVIKLLIQAWASPKDKVLVHLPTFPRYALEAQFHGCDVIGVKGGDGIRFDADAYAETLRNNEISIAFICSPSNPTGEVISNEVVEHLATSFTRTIFIVDEALISPIKEGALRLTERLSNVAVLRTFSKAFGLAGMRVGYVIASEGLIDVANLARPPFNVSLPAAAAAVAALEDEAFILKCNLIFGEECDHFRELLQAKSDIKIVGFHGNMILLELETQSSSQAASTLASQGIVVADATSFDGLQETATLRVSLRQRDANKKLVHALLAL